MAEEVLADATLPQVICLGEALVDRIFEGSNTDPAARWVDCPGGAPANVATALAKLGTASGFVGGVGPDAAGKMVLAALAGAGVNCGGVQRSAAPTRVVLVERDSQGDRTFVGFQQGASTAYADAQLDSTALPTPWFEQARYLVMGTLGLAAPSLGQAMARARDMAQHHRLTTVVDLNWRSPFWPRPDQALQPILSFLNQIDILKLNQAEADWLFQTRDPACILNALERPRLVLLTHGDVGCWYATPTETGHVPSFAVPCLETTGAGDAFLAGLIHSFCRSGDIIPEGDSLVRGVRYANATGALTTTGAGAMAAQPTAPAVESLLAKGLNRS